MAGCRGLFSVDYIYAHSNLNAILGVPGIGLRLRLSLRSLSENLIRFLASLEDASCSARSRHAELSPVKTGVAFSQYHLGAVLFQGWTGINH